MRGDVTSVTATVPEGHVTVQYPFRDARRAQVQFDARDANGRVLTGRHRISVRFLVGRRAYAARIDVEIDGNGTRLALSSLRVDAGNEGARARGPARLEAGALGRRSSTNLIARRDGADYVLQAERPRRFSDARDAVGSCVGRRCQRSCRATVPSARTATASGTTEIPYLRASSGRRETSTSKST